MIIDPMDKIVAEALEAMGIRFIHETQDKTTTRSLDFYLPDYNVFIECKRYHSDWSSNQLRRAENVILIQGKEAALLFATMLSRAGARPNDETKKS